jgi:hypothetical protein
LVVRGCSTAVVSAVGAAATSASGSGAGAAVVVVAGAVVVVAELLVDVSCGDAASSCSGEACDGGGANRPALAAIVMVRKARASGARRHSWVRTVTQFSGSARG